MATVKWESGGAASWTAFHNGVIFVVNIKPNGPSVIGKRTAGRYPVGTLQIGDVTIRILPGQTLEIEDRLKPAEWRVRG